jgi:hypothetical protein
VGTKSLPAIALVLATLVSTAAAAATSGASSAVRPPGMTPSLTPHAPYTVSGRLSLISENRRQSGSECMEQDNDASIQAGAPITITDATGRVLGVGHLATGHPRLTGDSAPGGTCDLEFVVGGIPEVEWYRIGLGQHGSLQYSLAEMKQQNWAVRMELQVN